MRGTRFAMLAVLALVAGCLCSTAWAGENKPLRSGPLVRAVHGVKDILLSPFEIPATIRRVAEDRDVFFAIWAGSLEGVGNGLVRLSAGVVELGTSPIPGNFLPLYSKRLGERALPPARAPIGITRP